MSSSMSTGDRRWASSTRRSGMTVLGKVAVPKPINLPSQRLENHGLDPNVEIVPKGTYSWGSKSSSQTNAWGSSSVSPSTDSGTGSPSHLSGRPSSVGSNTRPSTAGSDRLNEPSVNTWGPNSRPSSASGALSSNQSSLSTLRPQSAETRPGSSQLSRFAEHLSENTVASVGTTDKGISSSNNDGFSLTSGDFPTLGSEKEKNGKNTEPQGDANVTASSDSGGTDTWTRDEQHVGEDDRPSEKRQEDALSYPNASIPPHHYDKWHGPPVNNPSGVVWYRGSPYAAPLPPGGFPMEPFPYYRPQFPANSLGNPQLVPPQGAGLYQPMNGDMYRPLMPDACIPPGLSIRPGFYPGPVPYGSYYRPPIGYGNPSEQDMSFMGMPFGPNYSGYPSQNAPDPASFRVGSGGHTGKALAMEQQVESDHFHDSRGPYKLLVKQHNSSDDRSGGQMLENPVEANFEKGDQHRNSRHDDWEVDNKEDRMIVTQKSEQSETNSRASSKHVGSKYVSVHSSEKVGKKKLPDKGPTKKMEISASSLNVSRSISPASKDSTLIQKIEGLNAKARVPDTQLEIMPGRHKEEQDNKTQINPKAVVSASSGGTGSLSSEEFQSFRTRKPEFSSRRYTGKQNRIGDHGKGNVNKDFDSWRKTTPAADSSGNVSGAQLRTDRNQYSQVHHDAAEGSERPAMYSERKHWGGPAQQMLDGNNIRGQEYAKTTESANQYSTQLQKEGEHMKKQMAKALENQEEVKKQPYGAQDLNQKLENVSRMNKTEESCTSAETKVIAVRSVAPNTAPSSASDLYLVAPVFVEGANRIERLISGENLQERRPKRAQKKAAAVQKQHLSRQMEVNNLDASGHINVPQDRANTAFKNKRSGYKHEQNVHSESMLADNCFSSSNDVAPKGPADEADKVTASVEVVCDIAPSCDSSAAASQKAIPESVVNQKRRSNWTGKGKQRVNEVPTLASIPLRKAEIRNTSVGSGNPESVESELVLSSVQIGIDSKDASQSSVQNLHVHNEGNPDGVSSQWKSQHSRRMPRNPQGNKSSGKFHGGDAVMWAPVRSQNRTEVTDDFSSQNRSEFIDNDTSWKTVLEAGVSSQSVNHRVQVNSKSKRAEMERYVPKPVAKEMAQQANIQQSMAPSRVQSPAGEAAERVDCDLQSAEKRQPVGTTIGKGGPDMKSRNEDVRHNKPGKAHGSWHQHSSEYINIQSLHCGSSYSSNASKNNSMNTKPDNAVGKEQTQDYSDQGASDGWNIPDCPDTVPQTTLVKDQGATAGGKRQFYKGHKGTGNSYHQDRNTKNEEGDNLEARPSGPDLNQIDFTCVEENCSFAERPISYWQPKPRGASHRRGGRSSERDDIRTNKREYLPHIGVLPQQHKEASRVICDPHPGHALTEESNVDEVPDQYEREKKPSSSGGRPQSPNQASVGLTESISPATANNRHGQHTSSHRNVRSNRFSREHDSRAEWGLRRQDYRQHNLSGNWERQRNKANYQYKPVRPYNSSSNDNEGSKYGFQETGSKYAERGQTHSRRGRENPY